MSNRSSRAGENLRSAMIARSRSGRFKRPFSASSERAGNSSVIGSKSSTMMPVRRRKGPGLRRRRLTFIASFDIAGRVRGGKGIPVLGQEPLRKARCVRLTFSYRGAIAFGNSTHKMAPVFSARGTPALFPPGSAVRGLLLTVSVGLLIGLGTGSARAQLPPLEPSAGEQGQRVNTHVGPLNARADKSLSVKEYWDLSSDPNRSPLRSKRSPVSDRAFRGNRQARPSSPSFGEVFVGSAIGVGLGVPFGTLLMKGAVDENTAFENEAGEDDNCCEGRRLGIGLLGAALIGGGGPLGVGQRIDSPDASVYAAAVGGQLALGGLGFGLGWALGNTQESSLALGLALGTPLAAVGAAGGAVAAHESDEETGRGGAHFQNGEWNVGLPRVNVRPPLGGTLSIHVTLLSARF